jgi:hypothetical protein
MKVDTMRWIDRCVGAPLCALVTPLVRLWHIARARPPRTRAAPVIRRTVGDGQHHPGRAGHAKGARSAARGAILRHLPLQRFTNFSLFFSPWVDEQALLRKALAVICPSRDTLCMRNLDALAKKRPQARRLEVDLTPRWLGFAGIPDRFVIAIMPPRSGP